MNTKNNKEQSFRRNVAISLVAAVAGSAVGADLAARVTDSEASVALASLASRAAISACTFVPLHIFSNYEKYFTDRGGEYKRMISDFSKIAGGAVALDIPFYFLRGFGIYELQKQDINPSLASLFLDAVIIPCYSLIAGRLAKIGGLLHHEC